MSLGVSRLTRFPAMEHHGLTDISAALPGGMTDSHVLQRTGRRQDTSRPAFDLLAAKILRPRPRRGTIPRSLLVDRLVSSADQPIVSVVAPAGYGKTTLLSQWAERDTRVSFAWVSVDEADNDPKVLLTYIAEALDAIEPVGGRVFEALAAPLSSVPGSVVPRLGSAFASMTSPVVLVLDDVHLVHDPECQAAVSVLADHVPVGSRLVLAGRVPPPLRIARLRAEGKILEIGRGDLSLDPAEASSMLRRAGVTLAEDQAAELHRRTEGWPVGLYLAALYFREGGVLSDAFDSFRGDDRFVSEYMKSELLARISSRRRVFLTRTAVLERMCGPLCDAVLGVAGSGETLAALARSNMLLVPLDRRGQWYRYHHLFRDMLLGELEREEPGLLPALRSRAADWHLRNDLPEIALEYSIAAGNVDAVADLVQKLWLVNYRQARITTLRRWFRWLEDHGGLEGRPLVAVYAAFLYANMGRPVEAERWADAADRWMSQDGARPLDPWTQGHAALLRAVLCRRGVDQMLADADETARAFAATGLALPVASMVQGIARVLCGDPEGGDVFLADAADAAEGSITFDTLAHALSERSLLAMDHGDWARADALTQRAGAVMRRAGAEDALVSAVRARVALHRRDAAEARRQLISGQRALPLLTYALPHLAIQARVSLARVHFGLGELAGARTLTREISELLNRRPGMGTLVDEAQGLRVQLATQSGLSSPGPSALTTAELRLLPLLPTHLSLPEIAARLVLSPHTIKSQAYSIYRKLGASSRSQAVARSRELGLLEG